MDKLQSTYFFRGFDASESATLKSLCRIVEARKGDLILRQGQASDHLYIVRTGSVKVNVRPGDDDEEAPAGDGPTLIVLGPGECFGEFAFVDRKPSSATVLANEDATLYRLYHQDLDDRLLANPATAAKFYKALLDVMVARFRNTDIELAVRKAILG